jgi:hypothetical protein
MGRLFMKQNSPEIAKRWRYVIYTLVALGCAFLLFPMEGLSTVRQVVLTTYYPAPYGRYNHIQTRSIAVSDWIYSTNSMGFCASGTPSQVLGSIGMASNNDLQFMTSPQLSVNPTERMRITSSGSIGIGTTSPNAYALLDVFSNDPDRTRNKGFLPPRMLSTLRPLSLGEAAAGLLIYGTDDGYKYWNGTDWKGFGGSGPW